ncbi:hypothetical protein C9374_006669 [Naegleria lovaniensis]|uniref:F-box domain-containing protein n=1 Tax=Naegleria lovaniensis TaxID=51637 RepID=A0AA88GHJ4_NAELO|nr:uncharacterized protein C9374_006669 [Naegleria lovaniensis]KAG2379552.1 hypothetical protein C9374_006669 [Naegleria lovaniensis]
MLSSCTASEEMNYCTRDLFFSQVEDELFLMHHFFPFVEDLREIRFISRSWKNILDRNECNIYKERIQKLQNSSLVSTSSSCMKGLYIIALSYFTNLNLKLALKLKKIYYFMIKYQEKWNCFCQSGYMTFFTLPKSELCSGFPQTFEKFSHSAAPGSMFVNRTQTGLTMYAKYIQEVMDKKEKGISQKYFTLLQEENLEMSFKYHCKKWMQIVKLLKWSVGLSSIPVSKRGNSEPHDELQVGASKFGGYAEVPKTWIENMRAEQIEDRALLAQIRCEDIYKILPKSYTMDFCFPSEGWIYVFAPLRNQYNYSEYVTKYYGGDVSTLVPYILSSRRWSNSYPISFNIQVNLPDHLNISGLPSHSISRWFDQEEGSVFSACMEMQQKRNYLFGHGPSLCWSERKLNSPLFLCMGGHEEIVFGDADVLCVWGELAKKSEETMSDHAISNTSQISIDKVEVRISC